MKKQTIKLNEAQLRRLIKESVKKTLNEMYGGLWNSDGEWTGDPAKTAEVEFSGEDIVSIIVDDFTGYWPTKEYFEDPEKLEKLYSRGWGPDIEFLQQQGIDPSDTQTVINFVKKLAEDEFNGSGAYIVEKDELFGVTRDDGLRVDLRDFFNKYADKFSYFDNGSDDLYDDIIDNIECQEPYDSRPDKIEDDD